MIRLRQQVSCRRVRGQFQRVAPLTATPKPQKCCQLQVSLCEAAHNGIAPYHPFPEKPLAHAMGDGFGLSWATDSHHPQRCRRSLFRCAEQLFDFGKKTPGLRMRVFAFQSCKFFQ